MKITIGIDPGTLESGVVVVGEKEDGRLFIISAGNFPNEDIVNHDLLPGFSYTDCVIEKFIAHGTIGSSSTETIFWAGRFFQKFNDSYGKEPGLVGRTKVLNRILTKEEQKAKGTADSKVRRKMIEHFGKEATKKAKVTEHAWQALGLVYAYTEISRNEKPGHGQRTKGVIRARRKAKA